MTAIAPGALQRTFPLDPNILGPGSAVSLQLTGSTDADVISAVALNQPFPTRQSGIIDLAHVSLTATGGNPVLFQGNGTTIGFAFSAGVTAGAGIFDHVKDAIAALSLAESPGLDLTIDDTPGSRYALLSTGYTASGSVSGAHPIGVIGSLTFGASAAAAGLSAVLHRFPDTDGAATVLGDTIESWKLPRHVNSANSLAPGTWLITEASGSLAVNLAAKLGYNFNFVKQVQKFGLSGDIGLKIDAAATATFGFNVSGRYLIVLGRESDDSRSQKVRLRMFKLNANGMQFGLNLKVGVTGVETLTPASVDDFVKAVFGVNGVQIVNALNQIQNWTDPTKDVGQLVAGLVNKEALQLLETVTGVNPQTAFDVARNKLIEAINLYQSLPDKVSSELLGILNGLDATAATIFQDGLKLLASVDPQIQKQAIDDILSAAGFADSPLGKFITSLADNGLLNLVDQLTDVRNAASTVLSILGGGIIAKLEQYINDKLDLSKVINAVQQTDFDKLDSFLIGRLSTFFDKTLGFADLNDIKNAINLVVANRQKIYDKAVTALNSRYGLDIAATWQNTSSTTAILDVIFDLSDASAQQLFQPVVQATASGIDQLFTTPSASVQINKAVISHEITRKSDLEISLPHFNFQTQSVTTALASVSPEDDGGRILLYDAKGTSTVSVKNKFNSSLSVTVASAIASMSSAGQFPDLRVHSTDKNTWTYQLRYVKANIRREELEAITRPFLTQYMADHFSQGTTLSQWYNLLESSSEEKLHNGPDIFGDTCLYLEVDMPAETIGAWVQRVNNVAAAGRSISVAIQQSLKTNLLLFYLNDISKLANPATSAPILAWSSIPPASSFDGNTFRSDTGNNVFWDHLDKSLRGAAVNNNVTGANLQAKLAELRLRLEEAGLHSTAQFYQDNQVQILQGFATNTFGDVLLGNLLSFESQVVSKANEALKDIQKFLAVAGTSPTQAVERLAQFAADIVTAFNKLIGTSDFANLSSFRAVAQVVFADASRALNTALTGQPRALLLLDILLPTGQRTFQLPTFLDGAQPPSADIAVPQCLVTNQ